nr:RNase adapter RapZ [Ferroacidibacillus organovorans]
MAQPVRMLIITGMSGAGKTLAVQSLEDLGFFCVDNLPPALIRKFSELLLHSANAVRRVALVCDLRGGAFFDQLFDSLTELEEHEIEYQILYLEADDETLVRRYKASRRKHPLSANGRLVDGINRERELLKEVRERAHVILNTSRLRPLELKDLLTERFRAGGDDPVFSVNVISFGFKYGLPIDADLVFDVRFLPNPYYVEALRPRTGQDPEVYDYIMGFQQTEEFVRRWFEMIDFLLPQYENEGKSQIIIGIGCTGGRHRSVALAERLREHLQARRAVTVTHRDVGKDGER